MMHLQARQDTQNTRLDWMSKQEVELRDIVTVQTCIINQQTELLLKLIQDVETLEARVRVLIDTQGRTLGNPIVIEDDEDKVQVVEE